MDGDRGGGVLTAGLCADRDDRREDDEAGRRNAAGSCGMHPVGLQRLSDPVGQRRVQGFGAATRHGVTVGAPTAPGRAVSAWCCGQGGTVDQLATAALAEVVELDEVEELDELAGLSELVLVDFSVLVELELDSEPPGTLEEPLPASRLSVR